MASVAWAKARGGDGDVAFVGFSIRANLVLNAALKKSVSAVVDYFGPVDRFGVLAMPDAMRLSDFGVSSLPVLIHHGNQDIVVPDSQSQKLKGWPDRQ